MGLPPLEYSDCFLDSPLFREIIALYEQELETNTRLVKNLVRECDNMIQKTEEFSKVQQSFGHALSQFKFQTIGTEQTEDEQLIAGSLQSFAHLMLNIEDYRHNMLNAIKVRLLKTLEQFRKNHMKKALEEKKRFDDASRRYYSHMDNYLSIKPPKKKDVNPPVGDDPELDHFEREKAQFRQISFDYVCRLQDVHAQKHYELIEPIIGYISDVSTFLHQAYEEASSLKPQIEGVQFKVQLLRETHENEQEKAYHLKAQVIEEGQHGMVHHPEFVKQGIVLILDKKKRAVNQWVKYFCQFRKQDKKKMIKFSTSHKSISIPTDEWMEVKDCVRTKAEEIDRKFCFDLICSLKGVEHKFTVQAVGQDDRNTWIQVMEGREPMYLTMKALEAGKINAVGYKFIEKCINTIEERGLEEEGLYRRPGVLAKASKLFKESGDKSVVDGLDFTDDIEFDTKTLASAVKGYFAKYLGEPVMTHALHHKFIETAKINDLERKTQAIKELIYQLPKGNIDLLSMLIAHLKNVADMCNYNLMKASNLGVCFGPTLMRPEHETVASIVDIRYQNIIVEFLILNVEEIFPGAKACRPYPRPKGMKQEGETFTQSDSYVVKRRPPPAAPSKRISAVDFMKRSQETRSHANTVSTSSTSNSSSSFGRQANSSNLMTSQKYDRSATMPEIEQPESKPLPSRPPPLSQKPTTKPQSTTTTTTTTATTTASDSTPTSTATSTATSTVAPVTSGNINTAISTIQSTTVSDGKSNLMRRSPPSPPKTAKPVGRRAKALYDCDAEDEVELSFAENEILYNIMESDEPDWLLASNEKGQRGLIPANYIEWLNEL